MHSLLAATGEFTESMGTKKTDLMIFMPRLCRKINQPFPSDRICGCQWTSDCSQRDINNPGCMSVWSRDWPQSIRDPQRMQRAAHGWTSVCVLPQSWFSGSEISSVDSCWMSEPCDFPDVRSVLHCTVRDLTLSSMHLLWCLSCNCNPGNMHNNLWKLPRTHQSRMLPVPLDCTCALQSSRLLQ